MNAEQASKQSLRTPTPRSKGEGRRRGTQAPHLGENKVEQPRVPRVRRGSGDGMSARRTDATRETHTGEADAPQLNAREGQVRLGWESDGSIVPKKRVTTVEGRDLS